MKLGPLPLKLRPNGKLEKCITVVITIITSINLSGIASLVADV